MTTDRAFRRLVFLSALVAMVTYAVAAQAMALGVVCLGLALVGWRVTEGRGDRAVPRAMIALAITLAIAWAIVSGVREGLNVEQFCRFTIAVIVIKTFDRRTSADLGQFVMLSLFLAIGAVLTSNSLWMVLCLIPTLLLCVAAGVAYQFHLGRATARRAGGGEIAGPRAGRLAGVGRTLTLGWAGALVISAMVFLAFPRGMGADAFGQWGNAGVGMVTGFTNKVELGEAGLISTSSAPVLDLTVRAPDGTVIGAPQETFYLRGAVLDRYERGAWTTSRDPQESTVRLQAGIPITVIPTTGGGTSQTSRARGPQVELEVMVRNAKAEDFYLFTLWRPRRVELDTSATLRYSRDLGVVRRNGQAGRLVYRVLCDPLEGTEPIPPDAERTPTRFDSEPIAALAASIARRARLDPDPATRPIEDDAALASAIERYFDTGFAYTLDIGRPPSGTDPIEWFLLDEKQGHCEYFASAMVALCRSVGINARVVTGYVATEFNDATRHYIVRESNAHAWVEVETIPPRYQYRLSERGGDPQRVEIAPGQWQTRDPTPSGEFQRIHRPDPTMASRVRDLFEAINYAWITSVVAFDERGRASIVSAMRIDTSAIDAWAEAAGRRIRAGGPRLLARALENAAIASASTALLGVAFVLGWPVIRQSLRPWLVRLWVWAVVRRPEERSTRLAESGFYARLLRALSLRGLAKPSWRPPLEHARGIDDRAIADPAARVVGALYQVRYGRRALSAAEAQGVEADLAMIERRSGARA